MTNEVIITNNNLITYTIYINSFIFSILRKSVSYVIISILQGKQHRNKIEIGILSSYYSIGYGVSKLISGILSDFHSPEIILIFGLLISSFICSVIPYITLYYLFIIVFFLSGISHGVGGPTVTKIITNNYAFDKIGVVWAITTFIGNVGYMIGPFIFIFVEKYLNEELCYTTIAISGIIISIISYYTFSLTSNNIKKIDNINRKSLDKDSNITMNILFNFNIWCLLLANLLSIFVIKGLSDWIGLYFIESMNVSTNKSAEYSLWSEFGGLIGTIASGYTCEYFYGNSSLTSLLFAFITIPFLIIIPYINLIRQHYSWSISYELLVIICLFMSGFGINGPKTVLVMAIQQSCPTNISGSMNGIAGVFGQIGASIAGYGIGYIVHYYGWTYLFIVLTISMVLIVFLLIIPSITYNYKLKFE